MIMKCNGQTQIPGKHFAFWIETPLWKISCCIIGFSFQSVPSRNRRPSSNGCHNHQVGASRTSPFMTLDICRKDLCLIKVIQNWGNQLFHTHHLEFAELSKVSSIVVNIQAFVHLPTKIGNIVYSFCTRLSFKLFWGNDVTAPQLTFSTDGDTRTELLKAVFHQGIICSLKNSEDVLITSSKYLRHVFFTSDMNSRTSFPSFLIPIRLSHDLTWFCLLGVVGLLRFHLRLNKYLGRISASILKIALRNDFDWYTNMRVGEASNPGPSEASHKLHHFDCAFLNPTSLNGKLPNISCLKKHLLLFAETSATKSIQMQEAAEARREGFSTIFSPPVLPQRLGLDEDTLRGQATGTAVYSQLPVRISRTIDQSDWFPSGRLLQVFLELGSIEIQVFIIYGFQSNQPKSRARTDLLIHHAIELAGFTNHPTIFAGDFNHSIDCLRSCDQLWQQGYRSANDIFFETTGEHLPHTYKNQTSNDVAIFSPELVPLISDIHVNLQGMFAGHHPLCFRVNIPQHSFTKHKWHLPNSWIGLTPDPELIDQAYVPMIAEDGTWNHQIEQDPHSVLFTWSKKIEASVHKALKKQHEINPVDFPYDGLPRNFRGRCKPRKLVKTPLHKAVKTAWNGHYTPATDCDNMILRQRTKQIRRIQSLKHRVISFRPDQFDQLWEEWNAIITSTGFKGGFIHWILSFEFFTEFGPDVLPSTDLLNDMEQLLIHENNCQVADLHRIRKSKKAIHENYDLKHQHKKDSFKKIREPSPGILQQVDFRKNIPVENIQNDGWGLASLTLEDNQYIDASLPATLNGHLVDIIDVRHKCCEVMLHDSEAIFDPPYCLQQKATTVTPEAVANHLTSYWNQFWMNEPCEPDPWENFQTLLQKLPEHHPITCDILDDEVWIRAIKSMKSGSARGVDAWAPDELKMLPMKPIRDLKHAFTLLLPIGMPKYLMQARVVPLSKKEGVNTAHNTRPITIIALLYRLWSKIVSTIILERFTRIFPPAITGFLPRRKAQTFLYQLQFQIEVALEKNSDKSWGGLTLDLVKCFNTLQHEPCQRILQRLGVDSGVLQFWLSSIKRMQRFWMIRNDLVASSIANCGFPEGDCMSIVAMLGVSRLWVELIKVDAMQPHSFADNWSWVTCDHRLHRCAMEQTLQLARAIRLTIDWGKTWIWGTKKIHTQTLQHVRSQLLNDQVQLQTVRHARELGHIIHYQILPYRGTQKERHLQAMARLHRLAKQNWSIDDLAHIAQTACLTKALYGIETYACGEKYFQNLRTALSNVLVGPYANTNPYLVAMCASPYIKDPELIAIQQAIKATRDFHYATNLVHVEEFFYQCATCTALPAQVTGPAGALRFYLAKLSWQLDKQGNILVDAYITLHILYASLETIMLATEQAWMQNLTTMAYTKKGQQNGPPINRMHTLRLLQKFSNYDKKLILREIAGSRMDEHQKSTFVPENEGLCLCCGKPDSVAHRVLQCDATEHIRIAFPAVMDHLRDFDTIHTHLPVIFMHPDWDFDRFLHFNAPPPEILMFSGDRRNISLYTDGSCQFPELNTRWTSYSVVQPDADEQTILDSSHLPIDQICEQCYKVVALAQGNGPQSIPRAELQALITAFTYNIQARVVSDSAYALDVLDKVSKADDVYQLQSLPNYDLIQELFSLVRSTPRTLIGIKVKAHESFTSQDRQLTLDRIGNAVADYAAKTAGKKLGLQLVDWRTNRCKEDLHMMSIRQQHYRMLLALVRERQRQQQRNDHQQTTMEVVNVRHNFLDSMATLQLSEFQQFSSPDNMQDIVRASRFGQLPSKLVLEYLQMLKWPMAQPKDEVPLGISWLELYYNFQLVTGISIPVNVSETVGTEKLVWMDEQQIFTTDNFPYHRYVQYFRLCVEHLQKYSKGRLWPMVSRRKTKSLHVLGCQGFRNGFIQRPQLPYQEETVLGLRTYMLAIPNRTEFIDHPVRPRLPPLLQRMEPGEQMTADEVKQLQKNLLKIKRKQQQ